MKLVFLILILNSAFYVVSTEAQTLFPDARHALEQGCKNNGCRDPKETLRIFRRDDQRISILLRNWKYVFTNGVYIKAARTSLTEATKLANLAIAKTTCNNDLTCMRERMRCENVMPPFLPKCPQFFQFDTGSGSNVYLASTPDLNSEIPESRKLQLNRHPEDTADPAEADPHIYQVPAEMVFAHGYESMDQQITHYYIASELLAQYWLASEPSRLYYMGFLRKDYPSLEKRPPLAKYIRWKAREWIETNMYPASKSDGPFPLIPKKPVAEVFKEFSKNGLDTSNQNLLREFESQSNTDFTDFFISGNQMKKRFRVVPIKLSSTETVLPLVLNCTNPDLHRLIFNSGECQVGTLAAATVFDTGEATDPLKKALLAQQRFFDKYFIDWSDSNRKLEQMGDAVNVIAWVVPILAFTKIQLLASGFKAISQITASNLIRRKVCLTLAKNLGTAVSIISEGTIAAMISKKLNSIGQTLVTEKERVKLDLLKQIQERLREISQTAPLLDGQNESTADTAGLQTLAIELDSLMFAYLEAWMNAGGHSISVDQTHFITH